MAMAYSAVRWTISGDCFGGTEIWSTGFWTGNDASDLPGTSVPQATVDAVAARWQTFFTSANGNMYSGFKTNMVKAAYWACSLAYLRLPQWDREPRAHVPAGRERASG